MATLDIKTLERMYQEGLRESIRPYSRESFIAHQLLSDEAWDAILGRISTYGWHLTDEWYDGERGGYDGYLVNERGIPFCGEDSLQMAGYSFIWVIETSDSGCLDDFRLYVESDDQEIEYEYTLSSSQWREVERIIDDLVSGGIQTSHDDAREARYWATMRP